MLGFKRDHFEDVVLLFFGIALPDAPNSTTTLTWWRRATIALTNVKYSKFDACLAIMFSVKKSTRIVSETRRQPPRNSLCKTDPESSVAVWDGIILNEMIWANIGKICTFSKLQ